MLYWVPADQDLCNMLELSIRPNAKQVVSLTLRLSFRYMLTADEIVGQLFVLSILMQTHKGVSALLPRFDLDFDLKKSLRAGATFEESEADEDGEADAATQSDDEVTSSNQSIMDKAAPVLAKLDLLHMVRRISTILPRTHLDCIHEFPWMFTINRACAGKEVISTEEHFLMKKYCTVP